MSAPLRLTNAGLGAVAGADRQAGQERRQHLLSGVALPGAEAACDLEHWAFVQGSADIGQHRPAQEVNRVERCRPAHGRDGLDDGGAF